MVEVNNVPLIVCFWSASFHYQVSAIGIKAPPPHPHCSTLPPGLEVNVFFLQELARDNTKEGREVPKKCVVTLASYSSLVVVIASIRRGTLLTWWM